MCEAIAADLLRVAEDGQVEIGVAVVPDDRLSDVELAVSCCPNEALALKP